MAKQKASYSCTNCDFRSIKWAGCCPECNEWNSFIEKEETKPAFQTKNMSEASFKPSILYSLDKINIERHPRIVSDIKEWDRVLGGGILPGSFLILTGDPGIGKSTLLLQVAHKISQTQKVIYFSSEESLQQVKNRATRLGCKSNNLYFSDQASVENIIATGKEEKPILLIIDSIQNCYISGASTIPGTVAQLRESAFHLMRFAKEETVAVLTTGHITKEGQMAGPKLLEHMVDGVFYLQGEDRWHTRVLRSVKNRFGAINEVGFFEMLEDGMHEVSNINQQLLSESHCAPGAALVSSIEGSRPILLEIQILCVASKFGVAQRVVSGLDPKRIVLISAILEKCLKIKLSMHDIFCKVSSNFKIKESASDLGIALAILSSYFQKPLPEKSISIGEISLTGQIRPINQITLRIKEAEKFGMKTIFVSQGQQIQTSAQVISFRNVYELLNLFPAD